MRFVGVSPSTCHGSKCERAGVREVRVMCSSHLLVITLPSTEERKPYITMPCLLSVDHRGVCSMCWAREPDIAYLSTFDKYSWSVMKGLSTTIAAGAACLTHKHSTWFLTGSKEPGQTIASLTLCRVCRAGLPGQTWSGMHGVAASCQLCWNCLQMHQL